MTSSIPVTEEDTPLNSSWRRVVTELYPDALTRAYCVPPVHFNRIPYTKGVVPGTSYPTLIVGQGTSAEVAHTIPSVSTLGEECIKVESTANKDRKVETDSTVKKARKVESDSTVKKDMKVDSDSTVRKDIVTTGTVPVQNASPGEVASAHNSDSKSPPRYKYNSQGPQCSLTNASLPFSLWPDESQTSAEAQDQPIQSSDLQADFAQNHVLGNLSMLGKGWSEVMFIISQFDFKFYLRKLSCEAKCLFPTPADLGNDYGRGDFDILVIHHNRGILIGEVKSVGFGFSSLKMTEQKLKVDISKRISKAIKQLEKSTSVTKHILKGMASDLTMRKTIFLPYVSSQQLQQVLEDHPGVGKALCESLGADSPTEAAQLCVCSDQLSDPTSYWELTENTLLHLRNWWEKRMPHSADTRLHDNLYLDIVARFLGPATSIEVHCNVQPRVEVRTAGEAVVELGQRLARLVLTLQQVDLLHRAPRMVCLSGPPGTGKTLMLVQMGLRWCLQGHDVHIVSTRPDSLAASHVIQHQIQMTVKSMSTTYSSCGSVYLHNFDMCNCEADLDRAINVLSTVSRERELCVLMDEAKFSNSPTSPKLHRLVTELAKVHPRLSMWAAGLANTDIPPELQSETLTVPLRCAPVVHREIHSAIQTFKIHSYSQDGVPSPGDGMDVVRLLHQGDGHTSLWPVDCVQCGHDVATELRRLRVGAKESLIPGSPPPLQYRDVLILTRSSELQEEAKDEAGNIIQASGIVRGLRAAGIPVCVLEDIPLDRVRWERDLQDTALARSDQVAVAYHGAVSGLERRVVVWLRGRRQIHDDGSTDATVEARERLYVVSRCTTQLIVVDVFR